ncbi:MAG: hypothetical protein C7B45_12065 [Sulfobacillus acidophilus]|uniref:Acyltransferase n=1 Tax=Sulfobacillus acidophilus TaxID=53633 RepID=A0A2T2WG00_9FIRM|nr:MAG: hypothetical protein C7B45_12065 [Sulfobacillus acidophilus]
MNKIAASVIGIVAAGIVGVDVAGLAGVFGEPQYDAGARNIVTHPSQPARSVQPQPTITATPSTASSNAPSASSQPSSSTPPSSSPAPSASPPSSIFSIPPAIPVPVGAIPTSPVGNGADVTTIGDSVMVDAQPYLEQLLPGIVVDGKVSRQLIETPPVVSLLKAQGELHRYVVIELGTNGPFTAQQLENLMKQMGPGHAFVLVNTSDPRPWEQPVNQVIDQVAATYPRTILVNWYQAAQKIPQDFYPDDVHLKPQGALYYARLLANAILTLQRKYPPN